MRRPKVEILSKVRETCRCGATLDYEGTRPRSAAEEFRRAHAICRRNIWPWPRELTAAGVQSDGSNQNSEPSK